MADNTAEWEHYMVEYASNVTQEFVNVAQAI